MFTGMMEMWSQHIRLKTSEGILLHLERRRKKRREMRKRRGGVEEEEMRRRR